MLSEYTDLVFPRKHLYTELDIPRRSGWHDHAGMEFTTNLRRLRKRKGLDQGALSELIGVAQPTVQRWESGKREPKHADLEKLARALDVTVADLFRESGDAGADVGAERSAFNVDAVTEVLAEALRRPPSGGWTDKEARRLAATIEYGLGLAVSDPANRTSPETARVAARAAVDRLHDSNPPA